MFRPWESRNIDDQWPCFVLKNVELEPETEVFVDPVAIDNGGKSGAHTVPTINADRVVDNAANRALRLNELNEPAFFASQRLVGRVGFTPGPGFWGDWLSVVVFSWLCAAWGWFLVEHSTE